MQCCKLTKVMLNEFLRNRKRTFCLRSKKCCTVSYYKKKCQKELEIQMIERRERGMGVIAILLVVGSKFKFFFLFMH